MSFDPSRLRRGELVTGVSSILLLAFMFLLPWYAAKPAISNTASDLGASTSFDGWQALTHMRWLIVLTLLAGFALAYFQATRRAPAIPVTLSVVATVLALLTTLMLIYRVLINVPGQNDLVDTKAGAYLALLSAAGILYGAFESMRKEGISPRDAPAEIEVVRIDS